MAVSITFDLAVPKWIRTYSTLFIFSSVSISLNDSFNYVVGWIVFTIFIPTLWSSAQYLQDVLVQYSKEADLIITFILS